ncbi:MAG TPA: hypothetical protein VLZ55_02640 [Rhodanobacter sp.]|nr:hypothetical protein [Rhodanobacter sp.]
MQLPARQGVSAAHRVRVLRALGITPWTRRGPAGEPADVVAIDGTAALPGEAAPGSSACVVVLREDSSTRELDLLGRALGACGAAVARAARVTVRGGQLPAVPAASAYLVFGEAQAHALGRSLPVEVLQRAQIVLVDDLAQVLAEAGAKRRLWGALRRLRRTLATAGG